jgi:hypothetical protein
MKKEREWKIGERTFTGEAHEHNVATYMVFPKGNIIGHMLKDGTVIEVKLKRKDSEIKTTISTNGVMTAKFTDTYARMIALLGIIKRKGKGASLKIILEFRSKNNDRTKIRISHEEAMVLKNCIRFLKEQGPTVEESVRRTIKKFSTAKAILLTEEKDDMVIGVDQAREPSISVEGTFCNGKCIDSKVLTEE